MRSLVMKSIYAGLGLLGSGRETVEELGRKLAKQADVSEKEGEKIARALWKRSEKAVLAMQETLDAEVSKVLNGLHAATNLLAPADEKKPRSRGARRAKPRRGRAKR
jgi:polyhydroxyalkanoate synthesis regulator phasin